MDYIDYQLEPTYTRASPQQTFSSISGNALVKNLPLDDSLRIIVSVYVEKETDPKAEGTNVSPQRLCDLAG